MIKNIAIILFLFAFAYATDITACQTLSVAGTYDLTQNPASVTGGCFPITANNVILDCHGFTLDGDDSGSSDFGISGTGRTGLIIRNCIIHDFAQCVDIDNWDSSTVQNTTCQSQDQTNNAAFRVRTGSDNNNYLNITIQSGNAPVGMYIDGTTTGTNIIGTTCNGLTMVCIDINGTATSYNINNTLVVSQNGGGGRVAGGAAGIILNGVSTTILYNNTVANSTVAEAIWFIAGSSLTVNTTTVYGITGDGLYLNGITASNFYNTQLRNISNYAINVTTATNHFFNNTYILNQTKYITSNTATAFTLNYTAFAYNTTVGIANLTSITVANSNVLEGTTVYIQPMFISIDTSVLTGMNSAGTLTLESITCINNSVKLMTGFPTTRNAILTGGTFLPVIPSCVSDISTFAVTTFSGYALSPSPLQAFLVSPINTTVSTQNTIFQWICNNSLNTSVTGNVVLNGSVIATVTCQNNTVCNYNFPSLQTCSNSSWYVTCIDYVSTNTTNSAYYNHTPIISYITPPTPVNGANVTQFNNVNISATATCIANNSFAEFNAINNTAQCISNNCSYLNISRVIGVYPYIFWYQAYNGIWYNSTMQIVYTVSTVPGIANVTFTSNFTYSEFVQHLENFYFDYGPYILGILAYGFAFLLTRRYPATMIAGGIGLVLIFFLSGNIIMLAAAILSLAMGLMYKQASG